MSYLAHSANLSKGIPPQEYAEHIANVVRDAVQNATTAGAYAGAIGALLVAGVRLGAEFHDLGKLDVANQAVLGSGHGRLPLNHVDAGVAQALADSVDRVRQVAAVLIYAHHLGLPSLPEEHAKGPGGAFRDHSPILSGIPLRGHTDRLLAQYRHVHESVIAGAVPYSSCPTATAVTPLFLRIALSCLVDADHSDTARHYGSPVTVSSPALDAAGRIGLLNSYVEELARGKNDERNRLRSSVYRECRDSEPGSGMLACDSPVGSGKTTAVMAHLLRVAETRRLRRVIVVLPFTNIIDQSVDVYRKALVRADEHSDMVVAAHHHRAEFEDLSSRQFA